MRQRWIISIMLGVASIAVYAQVGRHQFINYDDARYITDNPHVLSGLRAQNIRWAFTGSYANNWHPLTWISHMVDVEVFGVWAGGHHLVSVVLHVANSILLYWLLRGMTGVSVPSALVAFLFALHPLHVESVAWAAERKDVLSTFFFMWTLWGYGRYVKERRAGWYLFTLGCLGLGLMSKPMLVTVPCVLLLLDWWPLERWGWNARPFGPPLKQLVVEKIPFLALSAGSCLVTYLAQQRGVWGTLGLDVRVANAALAYAKYIGCMFFPVDLAPIYPYLNKPIPLVKPALAGILVMAITAVVWRFRRDRPYLLFGWVWYLGTLVPVIGLVQVGVQTMADRYTYVPLIGLFVMLAWGLWDLLKWLGVAEGIYAAIGAAIVLPCAIASGIQTYYWHDSFRLFEHTIAVTEQNFVAYRALAKAHMGREHWNEAIYYAQEALRISAQDDEAQATLGAVLVRQKKCDQAIEHLGKALALNPRDAHSWKYLGVAWEMKGQYSQAVEHYEKSLRLDPAQVDSLRQLAWLRATTRDARIRRPEEAVELASRACQVYKKEDRWLLDVLGAAYGSAGRYTEAVAAAEKARLKALEAQDKEHVAQIEQRIRLYKLRIPYFEPAARSGPRGSGRE